MSNHKQAVLLVNLGSPDSTSLPDIRRYLGEFLMDKYVLDVPAFFRWILVYCLIMPFRPKKTAEAYQSIWWDEGSPLMVLSKRLLKLVQDKVGIPVELGMRYGNPSIKYAIDKLCSENSSLEEILLFPLYPHYAMASTKTVIEKTKSLMAQYYPNITLKYIESFYDYPSYISSLSNSISEYKDKDVFDYVLFSYHGIPERHVKKTDPTKLHCKVASDCCNVTSNAHRYCYSHHVYKTTELVVEKLKLAKDAYSVSFQSRLGNDPWLLPFTDATIEALAKKGVKRLAVVCPAFVSDCLETLEEMGEEGKEIFLENGGESFTLIPCLNERVDWVHSMVDLIGDDTKHLVV